MPNCSCLRRIFGAKTELQREGKLMISPLKTFRVERCVEEQRDLLQQQKLLGPAVFSHSCLSGFELLQVPGLFLSVGHRVAPCVSPQRQCGNFCADS